MEQSLTTEELFGKSASPSPDVLTSEELFGKSPSQPETLTSEELFGNPKEQPRTDTLRDLLAEDASTALRPLGKTSQTIGRGLGQGLAGVIQTGGGMWDLLSQENPDAIEKYNEKYPNEKPRIPKSVEENVLTKVGKSLGDKFKPLPEDSPLVYEISAAFGSSLPMIIPGVGVAGAAIKAGMSIPKAAAVASAFSATLESGLEAGGVAGELKDKGKKQEDINKAAAATFATNLPLLFVTDKLGGLFNFEKGKNIILKIGKTAFFEGAQEGGQEAVSNVATEKPVGENVGKAAVLGGLVGGSVGGIMHLATNIESRNQREQVFQKFNADLQTGNIALYDDAGNKIQTTGQERRIFDTLVAEAEKKAEAEKVVPQEQNISDAEKSGKVIGIDAKTKLPIIDTSQAVAQPDLPAEQPSEEAAIPLNQQGATNEKSKGQETSKEVLGDAPAEVQPASSEEVLTLEVKTTEELGIKPQPKILIGNSPQPHTILEQLPPQEGDLPEETFYKVKNDKTGEEQIVEKNDFRIIGQKRTEPKVIPYIVEEVDKKDINELLDYESSMPNGEVWSFMDEAGTRQFGGNPSGHSKAMQEFGPKESLKLLRKSLLGGKLTDKQSVKVKALLDDYRTNVKPHLESALKEINDASKDLSESETAEVINSFKEEAGNTQYDWDGNVVQKEQPNKADTSNSADEVQPESKVVTQPRTGGGKANIGDRSIDQYEPSQNTPNKQAAFKLSERVVELVKKYAIRFGENYNPSGTAGVFYPQTDNIFVKAKNDVGVAAHEVTHYLDKKIGFTQKVMAIKGRAKNGKPIYDPSTKSIRKELTDIYTKYYPGGKKDHKLEKRVSEGIAVFFERMVTNPVQTIKEYPAIHKDFLSQSGRYFDPIMPEFVREGRAIVSDYQKLSDLDKIGARVVDAEVMDDKPFLNIQEAAIYHNIDNKYPLEKLAKESGVHFTANDPSLIARIYDHVPMIIQHNLSDAAFVGLGPWGFGKETYLTMKANGEIEKKYDFNWHTLVTNIGNNLDDFNNWLVARRVMANYKRIEETKAAFIEKAKELAAAKAAGIDPSATGMKELIEKAKRLKQYYEEAMAVVRNDRFDKAIAERAYNEHKDRFKEEAKMFDDLVKADLELARTAGIVSDERYQKMIQEEGYATFKRQIENEIIGTGESVNAPRSVRVGKNKVSSLFRYGGSGKDIVSPVYSSMENHQEFFKKATRQMVYNGVAKIANSFPDVFQKIPLQSYKEDGGRTVYPQDKDPNVMMAYIKGIRVPYAVNKDLKTMIDAMLTPTSVGLTEKIFTGLAQAFTKGTTGFYLPFSVTNFIIDQLSATSNSWTKFKPIYTPISELVKALSNRQSLDAKYALEYFMLGGERQALLSFSDLNPKEAYDFIRNEKSAIQKSLDLLNAGGDILATPVKTTELLTRMSEFIRARKSGYSQLASLELAGRISTPFHHRGQKGDIYRFLTRAIPYLNASIQVLAQEARTLKNPKTRGRALFIMATISAAMVAGVASILKGTDDQKRLLKGLSVDRLNRFVFLPSPDGQTLIKIRVPQEKGAFATVLNMAIIDAMLDAKYSSYEYLRGATGWIPDQLNPIDIGRMLASWIPQAVSPALQVAFNTRLYPTIRQLEPDYMKYLPKDERVFENSSTVSKWFGPKIGLSPIQFDTLIEGYAGRFIRYAIGREVLNPFQEKVYLTASRQVIAFYAERQKNDEEYQQLKNDSKNFSRQKVKEIQDRRDEIDDINDFLKDYRKVTKENKDDPALRLLRTKILDKIDSLNAR